MIRGCASSSDGKAPGIYAPTIEGQEKAIRRAYELSGCDPATITMVEGHGTGTPVGDAIELTALKNVLGEGAARESNPQRERVAVGSIKSQIGHLKAVAGCAGMIKVVLALKHKTIPRSINVKEPPKLKDGSNIQDTALFINTKTRPWFTPPGVPRRAGVSSFGFGGANYHCVLEEYEPEHSEAYRVHELPQVPTRTRTRTRTRTLNPDPDPNPNPNPSPNLTLTLTLILTTSSRRCCSSARRPPARSPPSARRPSPS